MSTISGVGGVNRSWDSGSSRRAEHEARLFAKVDSDDSGGVDATELATMLAHTGQSGDSAELLKKMDEPWQGVRAAGIHERFLLSGEKTCIDCHKGIAHSLPDMSGVPQG